MPRLPHPMDGVMEDLEEHFEQGRWHCPACDNVATPETIYAGKAQFFDRKGLHAGPSEKYPTFKLVAIICAACGKESLIVSKSRLVNDGIDGLNDRTDWTRRLLPLGRGTKSFPHTKEIHLKSYRAACETLEVSPEASACMSRRCLQGILAEQGYKQWDLSRQIDALLADKVLPKALHKSVDAIRSFGNFGAHLINDVTTFQIIDVEPSEAAWCIEIAEQLMDHYYEQSAAVVAKIAKVNLKLSSAGRAAMKS